MGNHLIYHGQSPHLDDSPTHGWEPYSLNNTLSFDIIHNIQNAFEDTAKQLQATGARRGVLRMQQGDWVDDVLNDGKHDGVHGVHKQASRASYGTTKTVHHIRSSCNKVHTRIGKLRRS